jgi:hypothetical protein
VGRKFGPNETSETNNNSPSPHSSQFPSEPPHQPLAPPEIRCHRSAPPRRSGHRGDLVSPAPLSRTSPHRGRPPPPPAIHGAAAARVPNKRAADHSAHRADLLQSPPPIPRQMPTATSPPSPRARPSTAALTSFADPSPCAAAAADPSRGLAHRWSGFCWSRRWGHCEAPGAYIATWPSGRKRTYRRTSPPSFGHRPPFGFLIRSDPCPNPNQQELVFDVDSCSIALL